MNPGPLHRRALALTLLLGIALAGTAARAQQPPPLTLDGGEGSPMELSADALELSAEGWTARGAVSLRLLRPEQAPVEVHADEIRAVEGGFEADAVTLILNKNTVKATSLRVEAGGGAWSGRGLDASLQLADGRLIEVRGAAFAFDGQTLRVEDAEACPCGAGSRALTVRGGELTLNLAADPADAVVEAQDVTLEVGPAPILWAPSLTVPLDGRRSGLLAPELGFYGDDGALVGVGAFLTLGDAADLTPRLSWRSAGLLVGALRLRHAHDEGADGALEALVSAQLDAPGAPRWALSGRGAATSRWAPALRYEGHLLSEAGLAAEQRLGRAERLSGISSGALALGAATPRSSFTLGAQLLQPLERGSLWSGQTRAAWLASGGYAFRGSTGEHLRLGASVDALRWAPLGAAALPDGAEANDDLGAAQRLAVGGHIALPFLLGPLRIEPRATLNQATDVFRYDEGEELATAVRQRWTSDLAARLHMNLLGAMGGAQHEIEPELRVHALPLRGSFGDDDLPAPLAPWDRPLPRIAALGVLRQRWSERSGAMILNLGGAWLHDVEALPALGGVAPSAAPRELGVAGLRWRWSADRWDARADLDAHTDTDATARLQHAALRIGWTHDQLSLSGGLLRAGAGLQARDLPWQTTAPVAPWIEPWRREEDLHGAQVGLRVPFGADVTLELEGLLPFATEGVSPSRLEAEGRLVLGDVAGCAELGLKVRRLSAPEVIDVFLFATLTPGAPTSPW